MRKGFSLIELLVVIVIIAVLVGIAAPYYADYVREAKYSKAKEDLDVLAQAITLYNSREDAPYLGPIASQPPYQPLLGENDFVGLQGQYLTTLPLDPWSKNYKLDPYGCFVYSEGPDSLKTMDDVRQYYVKELALRRIEWEDSDGNRLVNSADFLYLYFNKPLYCPTISLSSAVAGGQFDIYENNVVVGPASASLALNLTTATMQHEFGLGYIYTATTATPSVLVCQISGSPNIRIGVHSIALSPVLARLQEFEEVTYDRTNTGTTVKTKVETIPSGATPARFAVRSNPIRIVPK